MLNNRTKNSGVMDHMHLWFLFDSYSSSWIQIDFSYTQLNDLLLCLVSFHNNAFWAHGVAGPGLNEYDQTRAIICLVKSTYLIIDCNRLAQQLAYQPDRAGSHPGSTALYTPPQFTPWP